jgi:hypothetical protein
LNGRLESLERGFPRVKESIKTPLVKDILDESIIHTEQKNIKTDLPKREVTVVTKKIEENKQV